MHKTFLLTAQHRSYDMIVLQFDPFVQCVEERIPLKIANENAVANGTYASTTGFVGF